MNIPFYRFVVYEDDGHQIYQCLHCGEKIDVGHWPFDPSYCCWCGVQYKGFILPKNYEYIGNKSQEETFYSVQEGFDWGDGSDMNWSDTNGGNFDYHKAWESLQDHEIFIEGENQREKMGKVVFRIKRTKKKRHYWNIRIDADEYYKRTGKKFMESKE